MTAIAYAALCATVLDPAYKRLEQTIKNDLRGLNIEPHPDLYGFVLRDPARNEAVYTVYVTEQGTSAYRAIRDARGYDLADESAIIEGATVAAAVSRIKTDHQTWCGPGTYPRTKELWEGAAEELCPIDCFRSTP